MSWEFSWIGFVFEGLFYFILVQSGSFYFNIVNFFIFFGMNFCGNIKCFGVFFFFLEKNLVFIYFLWFGVVFFGVVLSFDFFYNRN